jgi:hypothetical protein
MSNITANRASTSRFGNSESVLLPVLAFQMAASTTLYSGGLVSINGSGLLQAATASGTQIVVGVSRKFNVSAASGVTMQEVEIGCFNFDIGTSGDALTVANAMTDVYVIDDHTVGATSNSGARPRAGYLVTVLNGQAFVMVGVATPTAL